MKTFTSGGARSWPLALTERECSVDEMRIH
jgi:hypothetical protein